MMPSEEVILEVAPEQGRRNTPACIESGANRSSLPATASDVPRVRAGKKPLNWDLHSLSKAYHQGYLAGTMGMLRDSCPYHSDVVAAAWEGGWEDGVIGRAREETALHCDSRSIA